MATGREMYDDYLERTLALRLAEAVLGPNGANPVGAAQMAPAAREAMKTIEDFEATYSLFPLQWVIETIFGEALSRDSHEHIEEVVMFMTGWSAEEWESQVPNSPARSACIASLRQQHPELAESSNLKHIDNLEGWLAARELMLGSEVLVQALENHTKVGLAA